MVTRPCSYCGAIVAVSARYCDHCGTPLAEPDQTLTRRREPHHGRLPTWVLITSLVLMLIVGALSGFRYQAGHWPLAKVRTDPTLPTSGPVPPDPLPTVNPTVLSQYLRSIVSINVRGDHGNRSGTGFLVDAQGNVVTAAHVVEGSRNCITVIDDNGQAHPAALVKSDQNRDVALLRVPSLSTWPSVMTLNTSPMQLGSELLVLGRPKGSTTFQAPPVATVYALHVDQPVESRFYRELAEVRGAVVVEGSSGGPLVSKETGQVEGMIVAAASDGEKIAWAVPSEQVATLVQPWLNLPAGNTCEQGTVNRTVPVVLATITPMSGTTGAQGADLVEGVNLAVQDLQESLAAAGYDVTVRTYDDEGSPAVGHERADAAVFDPKVLGLVGSLDSRVTQSVAETLKESGMVMVAPTAAAADLTTHGWPFFNRLVASEVRQEPAAAKFAKERLNATGVLLVSEGTPAADAQLSAFEAASQMIGLPIVGKTTMPTDLTNLKPWLAIHGNPDVIYYAGRSGEGFRMGAALPVQVKFIGGESLLDPKFATLQGAQFIYFTRLTAEPNVPFRRHFEAVRRKFSAGYAAYGYDAANVILAALLRYGDGHPAQVPSRVELADLVRETRKFPGEASMVTFDTHGENIESWVHIFEWRQGTLAFVENFR